VAVGRQLQAVKDALPHGYFGHWIDQEFGMSDRTARNLMSVAAHFGKTEIVSDLHLHATAAYLLARDSVPRELAVLANLLRRYADELDAAKPPTSPGG